MPPRRGARQQQQKQQKQEPPKAHGLLREPEVTHKLMEYVLDGPNGKRTLSRLARVSKVLVEPGLGLLWKELDSLVPLISLFPSHLFKRAKRPGLGLAEPPAPEHWEKIVQYGERVRRLTYDEGSKSVSPSILSIIDEHRPRTYILPNLTTLIWRIETPAGLNHLNLFLNPELQNLTLEVTPRLPQISDVLADISRRTKLSSLSLTSLVPLPDDIPRQLAPQTDLDKLALMAPGALSPSLGRWVASLERLRALQLDLSGIPSKAVDEFFRHVGASGSGSGFSTPNSARSRDSGVFSSEDIDFTEIKKSMKKSKHRAPVEERAPIVGAFVALRSLQLTGELPAVVAFLRRIASPLTQLELIVEDPFDKGDWRNLCVLLSQSFGESLQSLKISACSASRFTDLVRSTTARADAVSRRLSLEWLTSLPRLTRLDIDLPESFIIQNSDVAQLAEACPNLEILRLCPTARFPVSTGPPSLTLDGLAQLTARCRNLETLAVVVNGDAVDPQMYMHRIVSSRTLLKLHLGHSWVREPLTAALALSHLAPHADTLRWFHEKNRPGFIETHALGWQRVTEMLPHLQDVRLTERWIAGRAELPDPRQMVDKAVEAKPVMRERVIQATPKMASTATQSTPRTSEKAVSAWPRARSTAVDATPAVNSQGVGAVPSAVEKSVVASPIMVSQEVDAVVEMVSESVDAIPPDFSETMYIDESEAEMSSPPPKQTHYIPQVYVPTIVGSAITLAWKTMLFGPNFVTARMQDVWSMTPFHASKTRADLAQLHVEEEDSDERSDVSEKVLPVDSGVGVDTDIVPISDTSTAAGKDLACGHDTHESHAFESQARNKKSEERKKTDELGDETTDRVQVHVEAGPVGPPTCPIRSTKNGNPNPGLGRTRQSASNRPSTPVASLNIMSEGSVGKLQQKDFTPEVDALLPQATALAQDGNLQEALDKLFTIEKQARNGSDLKSTTRLVKAIMELEYNARDYEQLNSSINTLSKKHGQLKGAIQVMVEQAMTWLDEIKQRDGTETWLELVETLRTVTEGKLFLETPRARVTLSLAHHHESLYRNPKPKTAPPRDSLITASDLLSDLQVETYSSMERVEKTKFILEQMRLLLEVARVKDAESPNAGKSDKGALSGSGGETEWVKLRVQSRKVNEQFLKEPGNEGIKLQFYDMMVQYGLRHHAYLDVAKYYHKVWETPSIKEDVQGKGKTALEHIVYYVALSPHDNEQSDMMHKLFIDPALEKLEVQYNLIKSFITDELMRWPGIVDVFGPFLRKTEVFTNDKHWEDLHTRVIEHNVRVIAKYYTRITLARLTTLLDLTPQQAEDTLCRLVVAGTVWARIDRPAGIVNFRNKRSAEDVMNDWSSDMQKLLGLVEKTWMGVNAAQAAQARTKA